MTPEQLDLLKTPAERAEPWRVAAQTAAHDPHFPPAERQYRSWYYTQQADKIERGEA
jgi:hypothetical protein